MQRGVGTSTNGSGAFGASLNILTDAVAEKAGGEISNSFGSFNTRKHTVKFSTGKINEHIEVSGRLSNITSDGYVDRAGKVVQFKQAVTTTATTISSGTTATILTINFTPKFSDSLILCQAFHSNDSCTGTGTNHCGSYIYAGTAEVSRAPAVGYNITKVPDARFQYGYSGTTPSWGTTSLEIDLRATAYGDWIVNFGGGSNTSLLVWEIAQ